MKRGKRYQDSVKLFDKAALYDPEQAVDTCLKTANAKFDETIELSVKLGVDPRHADQQVRGADGSAQRNRQDNPCFGVCQRREGQGSPGSRRGLCRRRGNGAEDPAGKLV